MILAEINLYPKVIRCEGLNLTSLNTIFQWHVARLLVKNEHQKNTCYIADLNMWLK